MPNALEHRQERLLHPSRSLSVKLGLTVAMGILVTSLFTATGVVHRAVGERTSDRTAEMQSFAQILAANLSAAAEAGDRQAILNVLRSIQYSRSISYARAVDEDGGVLASLGQHVELVGETETPWYFSLLFPQAETRLSVETEIRHRGEVVGKLVLAGSAPALGQGLRSELSSAMVWAMLSILAGVLIALFQQRRIVRPIVSLTRRMHAAQMRRTIPEPIEADGEGEIRILVDAYNSMIAQVTERDQEIARHRDSLEEQVERRTTQLRAARDEAEAAMQAKSRFLATMSHEIRTPLNGVLVMAELLAKSNLPPAHKNYAEVIARSGRSLLDLLNDILDLSKLEAGKINLESIPVNIDTLLHDSVTIFWEQARSKGLSVTTSVAADVPDSFSGDPNRLRQCLNNLIGNAIKFTQSGRIELRAEMDGAHLCLSVADTGVGIAADRQAHIFEAFEQADQSTTRKHGGTGLGLSIAAQLVTAMDGRIDLASTPGEGSTFTIRIPVSEIQPFAYQAYPELRIAVQVDDRAIACSVTEGLAHHSVRIVGAQENPDVCLGTHSDIVPKGAKLVHVSPFGLPAEGSPDGTLRYPFTRQELAELLEWIAKGGSVGRPTGNDAPDISYADLRVLVADDTEVNRQVFVDALGAFGIAPIHVSDGEEAIQSFAASEFDLVILDGSMPNVDGYEAARRMREIEKQTGRRAAMFVLATAYALGDSGDAATDFDAQLPKPFTLSQLEAILTRIPSRGCQPPALDPAGLDNLRALDARRPGAMMRVLTRLAASLPTAIERLDMAQDDTAQELRRAAHALKSISGSAGAHLLADLAADLEHMAAEAETEGHVLPPITSEVAQIRAEGGRVLAEIKGLSIGQEEPEVEYSQYSNC